jgi:nucleotide-binding universal stress UspA family protein
MIGETEPRTAAASPATGGDRRGEVVCAIVDPPLSQAAAHLGARLAERLSLRLALVHVRLPLPPAELTIPEGPHPITPMTVALSSPALAGAPPAKSDEREAALVCSAPIRRDTVLGSPAEALRRLSRAPDTKLLVLVDEGGGSLSSKLGGNVAREIIHDARCPLVLVAPDYPAGRTNVRSIVCGVDDDDHAATVADLGSSLADKLGAMLRFVHVVPRAVSGAAPEQVALDALQEGGRAAANAAFGACRPAVGDRLPAEYVVFEGDPAPGLRVATQQFDAGLLIVGRPQYATLGSAMLGSTAHELLRDGALAVVIAPDATTLQAPPRP